MASGPQHGSFQARDRTRLLTFDGVKLASVSSRTGDDQDRWTEMSLYLTDGGQYILEKVGRSVITHVPGCPEIIGEIPRFQDAHPGDDPDIGYTFHGCVPETYDFTELLSEEDRFWAAISTDPREIVDALYRRQREARFLPRISVLLIEEAIKHDEALGASWHYAKVD